MARTVALGVEYRIANPIGFGLISDGAIIPKAHEGHKFWPYRATLLSGDILPMYMGSCSCGEKSVSVHGSFLRETSVGGVAVLKECGWCGVAVFNWDRHKLACGLMINDMTAPPLAAERGALGPQPRMTAKFAADFTP